MDMLYNVTQIVHGFDPKASVILYGSRARGDARIDSDWDILILTSFQFNEMEKKKLLSAIFYLELETDQVISAIIHSEDYWKSIAITPLFQNIATEGVR